MLMKRNVYILLLALGGLQVALGCRTADFAYDPYYYELAKAIVVKAGYGFNFRPEPQIPPGFPALLAALMLVVGHSYAVLIRSMAIFTTLGLFISYKILNSRENQNVAGITCLLLASSPMLFEFATRMLFSDMPYFFTSMCFLWAADRLDSAANSTKTRPLWWTACTFLILLSILMRSTGIALAMGALGWAITSAVRDRRIGKTRMRMFLPLVAIGLAAEASWVFWAGRHPVYEWPVHGFQESYLTQLKLKNGNDPELGTATWHDVLKRPLENEDYMATSVFALLAHKQVAPAWYSPVTVIPLVVLLIGLVSSFRTGGALHDWYFVSYELMFLFWPWNGEVRFQIPVAPLAALYFWRGGKLLWLWARTMPRQVAAVCLMVAAAGAACSYVWGWGVRHPSASTCAGIWLLVCCGSAVLLLRGMQLRLVHPGSLTGRGMPVSGIELGAGVVVLGVFVAGVCLQMRSGWDNLHRTPEMDPNIEAAEWIREHSAADAVVMARWEARVYHYSARRVIWFPPSTDADLLMAGIHRFNIRYIVVTEGDDNDSYWKPSDRHCFRALMNAHPALFRRVHEGVHESIYECLWETHIHGSQADARRAATDTTQRENGSGANSGRSGA